MYSLEDWYATDLERIQTKLDQNWIEIQSLKKKLQQIIRYSDGKDRQYLLRDLPATQFYSSLNIQSYCHRWLNVRNLDYIQGMHDGGLPSLAIGSYINLLGASNDLTPPPLFVIRFAYQDDNGAMSTFCFYAEYLTNSWCVAICHDPFKPPIELRYDITHSSQTGAFAALSNIINNQEITKRTRALIKQHFKLDGFKESPSNDDVLTHFNLNYLGFFIVGEDKFKQHLTMFDLRELEAQPAKFDDLIANTSDWPVFLEQLGKETVLNEFKLSFSYQTDVGKSAIFYFNLHLSQKKCLLALREDSSSTLEPYYFCFPEIRAHFE